MDGIAQLITEQSIELDVSANTWREALELAGGLLEKNGYATEEYTAAMIAAVEKHGPYIVLTPGIAFAHARPSSAVLKPGLVFIRLQQPVEFGHPDNDPVSIILGLAATDSKTHQQALGALAKVLATPSKRAELQKGTTPSEILHILTEESHKPKVSSTRDSRNKILTVCGNGVGTSLFLKNTLESVLNVWGWSPYISVEATDTISAKGKATEADCVLTSDAIAKTLGDLGVPVQVIKDFTSKAEIDAALREIYNLESLT